MVHSAFIAAANLTLMRGPDCNAAFKKEALLEFLLSCLARDMPKVKKQRSGF